MERCVELCWLVGVASGSVMGDTMMLLSWAIIRGDLVTRQSRVVQLQLLAHAAVMPLLLRLHQASQGAGRGGASHNIGK